MKYILTQKEKDNLVPKFDLEEANRALKEARRIILDQSGFPCAHEQPDKNDYCVGCPIYKNTYGNLICTKRFLLPK